MGKHPATWYNLIEQYVPDSLHAYINTQTLATYTVLLLLVLAIIVGTRSMKRVPRGWQNFWEWTYEVFRSFAIGVMGPVGEKYLAFLATCFIFIFSMNLLGLIPGFMAPTTSINMTAALALTVFVYIQYCGFKTHGLGYLKHFVGEPIWMAPLNIPIHVIGELAKPLSLSIRLFGNIFGEKTVVAELIKLGAKIQESIYVPIPIHLFMLVFAIFGSFIQALIFTMLTAVYLSLAVGGHEEHHEEEPQMLAHSSLEIEGKSAQG